MTEDMKHLLGWHGGFWRPSPKRNMIGQLNEAGSTTMQRRQFTAGSVTALVLAAVPSLAHAANRKFVFKIKTKAGGIVGNIVIEATDMEAAKHKLRQRYPDCEILEAKEK